MGSLVETAHSISQDTYMVNTMAVDDLHGDAGGQNIRRHGIDIFCPEHPEPCGNG